MIDTTITRNQNRASAISRCEATGRRAVDAAALGHDDCSSTDDLIKIHFLIASLH